MTFLQLGTLADFVTNTSRLNYCFVLPFAFLFDHASVSITSIYITAYGLNNANRDNHINVGLQMFQLICIMLNWSTGNWVNTLYAAILALQFVIYFVIAVLYLKVGSEQSKEVILYNIFDSQFQAIVVTIFVFLETLALMYTKEFNVKPHLLSVASFMLAFPKHIPRGVTSLFILAGIILHLHLSFLF